MEVLKSINLGLRFLLEVGALVAVGYWGWQTGEGAMRWMLSVVGVAAVIAVWVLFVSPQPTVPLARPVRLGIEFVVWVAAGLGLYASGHRVIAAAFVVIAIISGVVNYVWD